MNVFVTGTSSHVARALLPQLCACPDIERVTGIDLMPPRYSHPKLQTTQLDIRSPQAQRLLEGHDALVHLAFVVLRGRMREREMFDINVNGSFELLRAAQRAGVSRLIHISSAAVYGSGVQLTEEAPLEPVPQFLYARHKVELEEKLAADLPGCVRLRPHVILGPHAQPLLKHLLELPCYVRTPEPCPVLQCVHEDDVARAVLLALARDVRGPFNLAIDEHFSYRDVIRQRHRSSVPLPLWAARAGLTMAWRCAGWGGEPGWIEGLVRSLTLDCSRANRELGWKPAHDALSMLAPGSA